MRQTFERGYFKSGKPSAYFYKVADTAHKKPYIRKECAACGVSKMMQTRESAQFCSKACSQSGTNNSMWTNSPGYVAQHHRVYKARGPAKSCAWGCESTRYEWANLTGDYNDINDFAEMCKSCHARFDGAKAKCEDMVCPKGHSFERDGYYSRFTTQGEVRQCKQCGLDRARNRYRSK